MSTYKEANVNHAMIYVMNEIEIYYLVQWLAQCVAKRVAKDEPVKKDYLMNCSTMKRILGRAMSFCVNDDYGIPTTKDKTEIKKRIADYVFELSKTIKL